MEHTGFLLAYGYMFGLIAGDLIGAPAGFDTAVVVTLVVLLVNKLRSKYGRK